MIRPHEIFFLVLALISEILGTLTGFGSSTYFVPIAQFLESLQIVLVITGLLHICGNIFKLIFFRKIAWKVLLWFGASSIVPVTLGAYLSNFFSKSIYEMIIGFFLMVASILFLFSEKIIARVRDEKLFQISSGVVSGFLTGLVGTGGAIRGLALTALQLPKEQFIATSAAIDMVGDIDRSIFYLKKGYLDPSHYSYLYWILPVAFVGTWIGSRILRTWEEAAFRKIVIIAIVGVGLFTFLHGSIQIMKG